MRPPSVRAWACAGAALAALAVTLPPHQDLILYNHSPSIPVGLYVREASGVELGSVVTVRARDVAPVEAARRNYAADGDRFIKRVAAVAGQEVCGDGRALSVNGVETARIFVAQGRATPHGWVGCRRLAANEILLLGDAPDSFDGRYWGPINARLIEGVWRPL